MRRHLVPVIVTSFVLAACGGDGTAAEPPEVRPPDDPGAVVLQIDEGVNFPDPLAIAEGHPTFTLFADGRVIARDRSVESGALLPLVEGRLAPEGVQQLLDEAARLGALEPLDDYGFPEIADADTTRFVVATLDGEVEISVYDLGTEDGVSREQAEARRELGELEDLLLDWRTTAADHVLEEPTLFTGETLLVLAVEGRLSPGDDEQFRLTAEGVAVDTRVAPVLCREIGGTELEQLLPLITDPELGSRPGLDFRQVLPGESGCDVIPQL